MAPPPDKGKLIGLSGRDDIKTVGATVKQPGFEGMEGSRPSARARPARGSGLRSAPAAAAGDVVRRAGLIVSTLNVVGDITFDPFGGPEALATTIEGLASHMRWAAAMAAPPRPDL
jgi:hypothetical protein